MSGEVYIEYEPRAQFVDFHQRNQRWACLVCHRRAGKTVACINELINRAIYTNKENSRYAYIAPFYRQAKDVAWEYLKQFAGDAAIKVKESELRVVLFNGSWITLYGADNPDALRGLYFDGAVLDEYGDMRPSLWGEVVLPTLADRKGWAVFIGTPKGKNQFFEVYERSTERETWYSMMLRASESGLLDQEELDEMRAQMDDDQYAQELECSFEAAVKGTYYSKIIAHLEDIGQITSVEYDPEFDVSVAADIGYSDSTALWFWQKRPDGLAIIDYEEAHGEALQYYFDLLKMKPYAYDEIWLPHDAKAKTLQTGRSTVEQFLSQKFPVKIAPRLSVQHGIDAVRMVLPHCWFDRENCSEGIAALRSYKRSYNEVTRSFMDTPKHDWASDGADGFRTLSLVAKDLVTREMSIDGSREKSRNLGLAEYTLFDLFTDRENRLFKTRARGRIH